jgi:small subunit ribosomal protein S17
MPKRILQGLVVSNKSDKTIVVSVTRKFMHPIYRKFITKSKKYHAHDEGNVASIGESVSIIESIPISKLKRWKLVNTKEA